MSRLAARVAILVAVAAAAVPAPASALRLDIQATLRMAPGGGAALLQTGTFTGVPLGSGTAKARTFVGQGRGSVVRFVLANDRGSVRGVADCAVGFGGGQITYRGRAKITGGTGAFRRMRARGLRVSGSGPLSGERFDVRLVGSVRG